MKLMMLMMKAAVLKDILFPQVLQNQRYPLVHGDLKVWFVRETIYPCES